MGGSEDNEWMILKEKVNWAIGSEESELSYDDEEVNVFR